MSRIRRALSDAPPGRGAEAPVLERPQPSAGPDARLTGQFRSEIEKLGGCVVEAGSEDKISEYIDRLLQECSRVAVSDLIATRWPGICDRIRSRGIEIVPALREFAGAARRAVQAAPLVEAGQDLLFPKGPKEEADGETAGASTDDLMETYKVSLFDAGIGITTADFAIADTGTLVLLSRKLQTPGDIPVVASSTGEGSGVAGPRADGEQHRFISLVPPVHVCLLDRTRIVANLTDLLTLVHKELYSNGGPPLAMTFISGPSRTADIELTLTKGVHGPREVHVLLV